MRDPLRNPSRMPRHASPAALLLGLLLAAAAHAGDVPDADLTVYEPQAFAAAAPVNALDMVQRVPGFVLVGADPEVRGYVGAQGNVLIDGAHPASKRDDLEELLRRIPAASVARIADAGMCAVVSVMSGAARHDGSHENPIHEVPGPDRAASRRRSGVRHPRRPGARAPGHRAGARPR